MQGFIFFCLSVSFGFGGKNLEKKRKGRGKVKWEEGMEKGKRKGNMGKGTKGKGKEGRKGKGNRGKGIKPHKKKTK